MSLFRVDVDCWYDTVNTRKPKRVREERILLIEAENATCARAAGLELAEGTSACGVRLVGVEWRRTVLVDLPVELKGVMVMPTTFRELPKTLLGKGQS